MRIIFSETERRLLDGEEAVVVGEDGRRTTLRPLGLVGEVGKSNLAVKVQSRRWQEVNDGSRQLVVEDEKQDIPLGELVM